MILRPGTVGEGAVTKIRTLDLETDCVAPDGSRGQIFSANPWEMDDGFKYIAQYYAERIDWCDSQGIPMRATVYQGPGVNQPRALDKTWYADRLSCFITVALSRPHEESYVEGISNGWPQAVDLIDVLRAGHNKIIAAQAVVPSNIATMVPTAIGAGQAALNLRRASRTEYNVRRQFFDELGIEDVPDIGPASWRKRPDFARRRLEQAVELLTQDYTTRTVKLQRDGIPLSIFVGQKDFACMDKIMEHKLRAAHFMMDRYVSLPTSHLGAMFDRRFAAVMGEALHQNNVHAYTTEAEASAPQLASRANIIKPIVTRWGEQLATKASNRLGHAALRPAS